MTKNTIQFQLLISKSNSILNKNKKIIHFLIRFSLSYLLLYLSYSFYLSKTQQKASVFACAPVTNTVAKHTEQMAQIFGYDVTTNQNTHELSLNINIENKPVLRLIEGCNGISIIILFLAFIIAFKGQLLQTIGFGIFGSGIIYILNIFRIVMLTVAMLKFPIYQNFLHQIIFPLFIYGSVFVLWMIWVNKFALKSKMNG